MTASGYLAAPLGRLHYARDACEEAAAIAAEQGDDWLVGNALITAGVAHWGLDDFDRAIEAHAEAVARFAKVGDEWGMSVGRALLARTAVDRGDPEAPALLLAAAGGARATGDRHILALVAEQQARLALRLGNIEGAVAAASECLALHESIGSPEGTAAALHVLGLARRAAGETDLAVSVHLRALQLAVSIGHAGARGGRPATVGVSGRVLVLCVMRCSILWTAFTPLARRCNELPAPPIASGGSAPGVEQPSEDVLGSLLLRLDGVWCGGECFEEPVQALPIRAAHRHTRLPPLVSRDAEQLGGTSQVPGLESERGQVLERLRSGAGVADAHRKLERSQVHADGEVRLACSSSR